MSRHDCIVTFTVHTHQSDSQHSICISASQSCEQLKQKEYWNRIVVTCNENCPFLFYYTSIITRISLFFSVCIPGLHSAETRVNEVEQESVANAKINARQHCVSLSCILGDHFLV